MALTVISGEIEAQPLNDNFSEGKSQLDTHLADTTPHAIIQSIDKLGLTDAVALTIASGAITVTKSYHTIDTEGAAATDDLVSITGGTAGDLLILRQFGSTRDITIKHATGNILTFDSTDVVLDSAFSAVTLLKISTNWVVIGIQGVKRSGDTMTGALTLAGTASNPLTISRTDNTINAAIQAATTAGSVYFGNADGTNFAIAPGAGLSTTSSFKVNKSTGIVTLLGGTTHGEVTGSPEGAVTAIVGSTRYRTNGGASTTLYVKESGTGNTGWVAK